MTFENKKKICKKGEIEAKSLMLLYLNPEQLAYCHFINLL